MKRIKNEIKNGFTFLIIVVVGFIYACSGSDGNNNMDASGQSTTATISEDSTTTSTSISTTTTTIPLPPPPAGFVTIPAGTFIMGDNQGGGNPWESPIHEVTLSQGFYIMDHEVTAGEYKNCVEDGVCFYNGTTTDVDRTYNVPEKENHPINDVSWNDTQDYVNWMNQNDPEYNYRLCTEAEWEYAARAGTTTKWSCGNNESCLLDVAWYFTSNSSTTALVKTKQANAWGVYDMHGNVYEWVQDWLGSYSADSVTNPIGPSASFFRVLRGGSFADSAENVRSAYRFGYFPTGRSVAFGFRLCSTK